MIYIKAIVFFLLLLLFLILALQNFDELTTPIKFRFLMVETTGMPVAFVAIFTFVVGVIGTGLYGFAELFKLRKQIRLLMREKREKDMELKSLRNLPVTGEDVGSKKTLKKK